MFWYWSHGFCAIHRYGQYGRDELPSCFIAVGRRPRLDSVDILLRSWTSHA